MRSNAPDSPLSALLLSPCPPDEGQKLRMEQVLAKRFGCPVTLTWQEDRTTAGGFRIQAGSEIIDWTAQGRLEQLKTLKDAGLYTEEEYRQKRAEILSGK